MKYLPYMTKSFTNKRLSLFAVIIMLSSLPTFAEDRTTELDQKHKTCLEQIAKDADLAYEEAMIWRGDGGGRRARHCEAMALFALGHKEEAASRLDKLAGSGQSGSKAMQVNYYSEAANFWLLANQPKLAYQSASRGLDLDNGHAELRISRARAYALLGRYKDAETDLTSVLAFHPDDSAALRYRADARRKLGDLDSARADIENALAYDPTSVETALLRGQIILAQASKKRGKPALSQPKP